jgi:NADPH:quinone reductase-like Zn-dependent oxidoreductase
MLPSSISLKICGRSEASCAVSAVNTSFGGPGRGVCVPLVLGVDGTGRVTEVGEGVRGLKAGDVVHGQFLRAPLGHGTFAEYALVTETPDSGALQRVPDGITAEAAAARITVPIQQTVALFAGAWQGPLHILVNNAGIMPLPDLRRTREGWELQFATYRG